MSLNWDITKVHDTESLTENDRVTLDSLIWASIPVGIAEITEDNAYEFYTRLAYYERVAGAGRHKDGESIYMQPGDVKRFIGLKTNVSRKTKTVFQRDMFDFFTRWKVSEKKFNEAEPISLPDDEKEDANV